MTPAEFIRRTATLPFVWGQRDCALWAADLVAEATGHDPAADLRGTYADWLGCRRVLQRHGGILALARARLDGLLTPGCGDGIAIAEVGARRHAGIVSHGRLFLKTQVGVIAPDGARLVARWMV